jgi:hypothetical protein
MTTLKFRPFATPGTTDFADTLAGWKAYLDAVADLALRELGSAGHADKGFDIELWNSIAFASRFLFAARYHDPPGPAAFDNRAWQRMAIETVQHMAAHPERFAGARLINGFETHRAGEPCMELPPPFAGIRRATPGALRRPLLENSDGTVGDPFLWPWPTAERRSGRIAFPEVEATALISDSFIRELAPSMPPAGQQRSRCPVWITGSGIDARVLAPLATTERVQAIMAKATVRQYAFFLGKGARRVMAGVVPDDADERGSGLLSPAFLRAARPGSPRPNEIASQVPPSLRALGHLVTATGEGVDGALVEPRQVEVRRLSDCHDHVQFRGGPRDPVLYNREVFVALPYQVNAHRFVVHYYVMTRDMTADLAGESYTLVLGGIEGARAHVSAYDPIKDQQVEVRAEPGGASDELKITLEAVDYPRVLVIDEQ